MKNLFACCITIIIFLACAPKENQLPEQNLNGNFVKATINDKAWTASRMTADYNYPARSSDKLVHGETDAFSLSFYLYKPATGNKRPFTEDYVVECRTDAGYYSGKKGEVTVTKADDQWIEGSFYFTATSTSSDKVYEVTNGSFRVETTPKK
jgi:hypothetical protein